MVSDERERERELTVTVRFMWFGGWLDCLRYRGFQTLMILFVGFHTVRHRLFNLNLHWVFVLISRWRNLFEMLVKELVQNKHGTNVGDLRFKMRFLSLQISPVLQWSTSKTHSSLGSLRYHNGDCGENVALKVDLPSSNL